MATPPRHSPAPPEFGTRSKRVMRQGYSNFEDFDLRGVQIAQMRRGRGGTVVAEAAP